MSGPEHRRVTVEPASKARASFRALVRTPYRIGCLAIVTLTVALRAVGSSKWSWYADDFGWMDWTTSMPFGEYVLQVYNGHLLPGQFLITWLIANLDPLNYTWVVLVVCLFAAASLVAWSLALRELFGERVHLLVALVILGMTPTMTGVSLWWSTALNAYSIHTSMGLCVYFLARWSLRGHQRRDQLWLMLSYAFGLMFWSKAVLITVPALFVILLLAEGSYRERFQTTVRALWPMATLTAVYMAGYVAASSWVTTGTPPQPPESRSLNRIIDFYWEGSVHLALPSLVGGPFTGLDRPDLVYPQAPTAHWVGLCIVAAIATFLGLRFRRRGWIAVGMTVVYVGLSWALILFNQRHGPFGSDLARVNRYWVDSIPVALLTLMFLCTPTRSRPTEDSLRRPLDGLTRARIKLTLSHALIVVLALTVVSFGNDWTRVQASSPKPWLTALTADATDAGDISVLDSVGPPNVVGYFAFGDDGNVSTLLKTLDHSLRFDEPTDQFRVVGPDGHIEPGVFTANVDGQPGPSEACGYPIDAGTSTDVPLSGDLFDFGWIIQFSYFTETPATIKVAIDNDETLVDVTPGSDGQIAQRQLKLKGPVTSLEITGIEGANTVCVTGLEIGQIGLENPETD